MIKYFLKIWGGFCLVVAVFYLCLLLFADASHSTSFGPGATSLGQWIGMGLLSLGAARIIDLLEKK